MISTLYFHKATNAATTTSTVNHSNGCEMAHSPRQTVHHLRLSQPSVMFHTEKGRHFRQCRYYGWQTSPPAKSRCKPPRSLPALPKKIWHVLLTRDALHRRIRCWSWFWRACRTTVPSLPDRPCRVRIYAVPTGFAVRLGWSATLRGACRNG